MWQKTAVAGLFAGVLASAAVQAQDPRYQDAVNAMKAQWQSSIPVAGVAALEDLHPDSQIRRRVEHSLDQIVVAAPKLLTQTTRNSSEHLY